MLFLTFCYDRSKVTVNDFFCIDGAIASYSNPQDKALFFFIVFFCVSQEECDKYGSVCIPCASEHEVCVHVRAYMVLTVIDVMLLQVFVTS